MAEPYPKNAPGPFYIENGCCMTCSVPEEIAPNHFQYDVKGEYDAHCFVCRQPADVDEINLMLKVMKHAEIDCLWYRGDDKELRIRLVRKGHGDQCD